MVTPESGRPTTTDNSATPRLPLPQWTVPVVAALVLVTTAAVSVLLWRWVDGLMLVDVDKKAAAQLDVLKLAASVAVGGGGLFALYLAARRQRTQELELDRRIEELAQREQVQAHAVEVQAHAVRVAETNRTHAEQIAKDSREDAAARRITELYSTSVAQLGSDKAPVRLGGLYALERLAQDNPDQRQTVVNVLCAYLRMPYELPGDPPSLPGIKVFASPRSGHEQLQQHDLQRYDKAVGEHRERVQEREVRVAAQRILRDHLRQGDGDDPVATFWSDVDLDLPGTTLVDFDLQGCTIRTANFRLATFADNANFRSVVFANDVDFRFATFSDTADFLSAVFNSGADFRSATFSDKAIFHAAMFNGDAIFYAATFTDEVYFGSATFTGNAYFQLATVAGKAAFERVAFVGNAVFERASFTQGVPPEVEQFVRLAT